MYMTKGRNICIATLEKCLFTMLSYVASFSHMPKQTYLAFPYNWLEVINFHSLFLITAKILSTFLSLQS